MSDDHICVRAGQGHAAAIQSVGTGIGEGRCGTHSVLVENSEVRNGHGISLGSDGVGDVRNVSFRHIYINGPQTPNFHHGTTLLSYVGAGLTLQGSMSTEGSASTKITPTCTETLRGRFRCNYHLAKEMLLPAHRSSKTFFSRTLCSAT